jgi:AraC-like DNA-binding protein
VPGDAANSQTILYPEAWIRQISKGVTARGHDLASHLARLGIDPDKSAFTRGEMVLVTVANGNIREDEALGLLPTRVAPGTLALRVGTMMTCPTLGAGIMVSNHLTAVTRSPILIRFVTEDDQVRLTVTATDGDCDGARVLEDLTIHAVYVLISWLVGHLITVTGFTTPLPDYPFLGLRHPIMNVETCPGRETSLTFPREALDWPIVAEMTTQPIWESMSWYQLALSNRVEGASVRILGQQIPLDELASLRMDDSVPEAEVGERQVRRRLVAELGKTFRDVKHDLMVDIAKELLSGTDLTLEEIAARLGYLEPRSFRRFIKGQTGLTPSQLRAAGRPQPLEPNPTAKAEFKARVRYMELDSGGEMEEVASTPPLREAG